MIIVVGENKLNEIVKNGVVVENLKPSFDSRFRATGFMIDAANNYIVTNAHVVKEASHHLIVENNKQTDAIHLQ